MPVGQFIREGREQRRQVAASRSLPAGREAADQGGIRNHIHRIASPRIGQMPFENGELAALPVQGMSQHEPMAAGQRVDA